MKRKFEDEEYQSRTPQIAFENEDQSNFFIGNVNPKMHDRNIHKRKPPNFKELASKYPSFAKL
jgi:hypothetical protein